MNKEARKRIDDIKKMKKTHDIWFNFVILCDYCGEELCKADDEEKLKNKGTLCSPNGNILPKHLCKCRDSVDYFLKTGELNYTFEYM